MTSTLFGPPAMPGWPAASSPGEFQPVLDASGQPVPEPDDGPPSASILLRSLSAGVLESPGDPGRVVFDGSGYEISSLLTAGRMVLLASSPSQGRRPGQIRYRWISDVLVRPRSGRRDAGAVRILFLDPSSPAGFGGRHFVDLSTARQLKPDVLAWDLVQRIAIDRHRWIPSSAPSDHRMVDELVSRGPLPSDQPAGYAIPMPSTSPRPGPARALPVEPAPPVDEAAETIRIGGTWSPPSADAFQTSCGATALAPIPESDPAMIRSVPGVGRHAAQDVPAPATVRSLSAATPGTLHSYQVEMDSGEEILIDGAALFGRDPAALDGEDVSVHAVSDRSLSFSKTHLLLTVSPEGISVTDRHSTNGVLVRGHPRPERCVPGVPALLRVPVTLQIGTRTMLIRATDRST